MFFSRYLRFSENAQYIVALATQFRGLRKNIENHSHFNVTIMCLEKLQNLNAVRFQIFHPILYSNSCIREE